MFLLFYWDSSLTINFSSLSITILSLKDYWSWSLLLEIALVASYFFILKVPYTFFFISAFFWFTEPKILVLASVLVPAILKHFYILFSLNEYLSSQFMFIFSFVNDLIFVSYLWLFGKEFIAFVKFICWYISCNSVSEIYSFEDR